MIIHGDAGGRGRNLEPIFMASQNASSILILNFRIAPIPTKLRFTWLRLRVYETEKVSCHV